MTDTANPQEVLPQPETLSFKRSVEIGKLVAALCKAQLSFDPIYKESENPAFKRGNRVSKYADLFSLVTATRKHLNNNGITIMQFPTVTLTGKNLVVTTLVAHESGEWVSHELLIPAVDERGFTAHSIGKAMTYARRFSWQAVTGAVAEDDDDGNEASGQGSSEAAQSVAHRKIAEARAKAVPSQPQRVACLFYVESQEHKGFVDWLNIGQYVEANQDKEDSLRMVFTAHGAKKRGDATLVPVDKMPGLLEKLAGDLGVDVKQLQSA